MWQKQIFIQKGYDNIKLVYNVTGLVISLDKSLISVVNVTTATKYTYYSYNGFSNIQGYNTDSITQI